VSRTRSEYRRSLDVAPTVPTRGSDASTVVPATSADPGALAMLLLDAYRGTIDDEGEGEAEARHAVDHYLGRLLPAYSVAIKADGQLVAMSFVVVVGGRHFIDPVATAAVRKGHGLGTEAVSHSLQALARDGVSDVGAVITDGNLASERLFGRLGFARVGPWG
jgi:hypothetical protein